MRRQQILTDRVLQSLGTLVEAIAEATADSGHGCRRNADFKPVRALGRLVGGELLEELVDDGTESRSVRGLVEALPQLDAPRKTVEI